MAALLNLLDPNVILTSDEQAARRGSGRRLSGSDQVARFFAGRASAAHLAIINGDVGIIVAPHDRLRRIAHRILGDWDQAEEAVQDTWLKTDDGRKLKLDGIDLITVHDSAVVGKPHSSRLGSRGP